MDMDIKRLGDIQIIKPLIKRLDASCSVNFKVSLIDLIDQGNALIVLNLSEINFIDSSGLGSIISIYKTLKDKGQLVLCEIAPSVMQLFTVTRIDQVLKLLPSEADSINFIQKSKK